MARRIYAGADFFAMPSRFEPCGQGQMIALRYGTPPIVNRTGGLADTVIDEVTHPGAGTGFSFEGATVAGLIRACTAAMQMRAAGGPPWEGLLDRGMAVDFDWVTGSAPRYLDAYRRAVEIRRRPGSARPSARSRARVVASGWVRWGAWGAPARVRMWPGTDARREGRQGRVGDQAAGRRVAADEPGRDPCGGRVREVGQAAVPVAVVEEDGARRGDIELDERLRLGADVLGRPGRVRRGERAHRRLDVRVGLFLRVAGHLRDDGPRDRRRIEQDEGRRPDPARGRPAAIIAPQL